jgi:UbiD family decarboxylase
MAELGYRNLGDFLTALRARGDLATVAPEVDPRLEVAEIHRRVIAAEGPALLFERVKGSDFPLVTNLFGTAQRAQMAFGTRPFELIRRATELIEELMPPSLPGLWGARDLIAPLLRVGARRRSRGPVTEVVSQDVRLDRLPVITTWPEDGGPFVTLPLVYTEHPKGGPPNLGMYRLQVHDRETTGMHWQIGKGGGFHYYLAEQAGEPLPVTVFLGGPPASILAAIAPLPENVPELLLASLLAGHRLTTCRGPGAHPLMAEAEFALIGHVPPHQRRPEGPFGDHYGYYSLRHDYPLFRVEWMARRANPVYPATVVGKPRQEDFYIGDLLQELLAPLFPVVMPGVVDLWSYGETGYHSLAAAIVRQRYKREAMVSAFRILGEGQLALTKFLLLTDSRVDLRDFKATLVHVLERTRPETDLFVFSNLAMDTLDYTGPRVNEGSKGVWLGAGEPVRSLPTEFSAVDLPEGVDTVEVFCPGCLVVGGRDIGGDRKEAERVVRHPAFANWPLLVLSDEVQRTAASPINFLWATFTRFEPASDLYAAGTRLRGNHVSFEPPILLDARRRPGFPAELRCDEKTAALVDRRWSEYFDRPVEMGDSESGHLDRV